MNGKSRTYNSVRNTIFGVISQSISVLLNFITRTVFITYLSIEYLGINGLFTNVLVVLSLAELGFGSAMVYSMYKPLADNNKKQIAALMNFYAKVYKIIGIIIGLIGVLLIPFLDMIIKDQPNVEHLTLIYILFLSNSIISYFFAYKRSIINADQKSYLLSKYHLLVSVIKAILQVLVLILFNSFIIYLLVQIFATFLENLLIARKADKLYPFLKDNKSETLEKSDKKSIWDNVKALMIYKIGSTAMDGSDNIIISAYVGVYWVGLLSNYTLIVSAMSMVVSQFSNAVTASVGNFIAKEDKIRQEFLLKSLTMINFFIYGFGFLSILLLTNPFIEIWIGKKYLLEKEVLLVIALNWYIFGMMSSVWTFRATMGLFVHGKYRPAISAIINVFISIYLASKFGLIGVLVGTTITRLLTNVWFDPLIVYKHGLKKSVLGYYVIWIKYILLLLILAFVFNEMFQLFGPINMLTFILQIAVCIVFIPVIFMLCFVRTKEYQFLKSRIKSMLVSKMLI